MIPSASSGRGEKGPGGVGLPSRPTEGPREDLGLREAGVGGRTRRRHVGLEARTLPTLPGCESRRERFGVPCGALSLEPETCGPPGRACLMPGIGAVYAILGAGGPEIRASARENRCVWFSAPPQIFLRGLGPVVSPPRSSVSPTVKWSWAFLTHPFFRWGP